MIMAEEQIRPLRLTDAQLVLGLLDAAVEWFTEIGNHGQWGTAPFSSRPDAQERARGWCEDDEGWVLERRGEPAAVIVLGDRVDYVPSVPEVELYVRLLVGSRHARGAGARLLSHATERGRNIGVCLLRVDCYAGGTGGLVRYYERQGFVKADAFEVNGWPGQVLGKRLST